MACEEATRAEEEGALLLLLLPGYCWYCGDGEESRLTPPVPTTEAGCCGGDARLDVRLPMVFRGDRTSVEVGGRRREALPLAGGAPEIEEDGGKADGAATKGRSASAAAAAAAAPGRERDGDAAGVSFSAWKRVRKE